MQKFVMPDNEAVVTTTYVTRLRQPILLIVHQYDVDEECDIWQFHSGNGDYSSGVLQLVALSEILEIDPTVADVASMPAGYTARRDTPESAWVMSPEEA